jgi:hypothetical protein
MLSTKALRIKAGQKFGSGIRALIDWQGQGVAQKVLRS